MWSVDYLVIELCGKTLCLLYKVTISVIKEYDRQQNYKTKHSSQYFYLAGKQWSEKKFLKHKIFNNN